jgi:hypothetical protein
MVFETVSDSYTDWRPTSATFTTVGWSWRVSQSRFAKPWLSEWAELRPAQATPARSCTACTFSFSGGFSTAIIRDWRRAFFSRRLPWECCNGPDISE